MLENMHTVHMHVKHDHAGGGMERLSNWRDNDSMNMKRPKPTATRRHFFREWRKQKGLTQERVADQIGITQGNLSRIENGKVPYDQPFLEKLAEVYGTDPGSLLMRNPLLENAVWSLDENLKSVDSATRARVIAVVDTMLKTG